MNPRPDKIREMCNMLEQAGEKYQVKIDMESAIIVEPQGHRSWCSTTCCHGGLYALAVADQEGYYFDDHTLHYKGEPLDYKKGANKMAEFLGFDGKMELLIWARMNEDLWGNKNGYAMFDNRGNAFGYCHGSDITLDIIIAHWRAVADRIEQQEQS